MIKITDENKKILEELQRSHFGKALQDYLGDSLTDMKDITNIESVEELQGRKYAVKLIEDLFWFMKETKVPVKSKNQYE